MERIFFTFSTTHHALWAEEVAHTASVPCEIVPAPPDAHARCNLALEVFQEDVTRFSEALEGEGVEFGLWRV